ncbi:MAG: 50S ribosome-binding GTPase [Planctomycetota bacterium]|nr:50S ribosome-binding GTPase [Planctomycetota bacterium]
MEPPPPSSDPICVQATAPGAAAIATFVLDGKGALAAFTPLWKGQQAPEASQAGRLLHGQLVDAGGKLVDEVVAAPLGEKESETGFEQLELSCHGGLGTCAAVRETLVAAGFRHAPAHELSARAHRAGKLGLIELETRLRLPAAATPRQAELLLARGEFQARWERLGMEASLGMRRREIDWREPLHAAALLDYERSEPGRKLLATHRVLLAGPVNAGKSTLSNRLLGAEASLVGDEPGTTRDRLERPAATRGLALNLIDAAGLRAPSEDLEREGQRRALEAAAEADLVLIVIDGSRAPAEAECAALEPLAARPRLLVLNKLDLGTHAEAEGLAFALGAETCRVCARDGRGLDELELAIERALLGVEGFEAGGPFTPRQARALEALKWGLEQGLDGVELIGHIRNLVGTRPNEEELAAVFREWARNDA